MVFSLLLMPIHAYTMSLDSTPDHVTSETGCHDMSAELFDNKQDTTHEAGSDHCCDDMMSDGCQCISSVDLTTPTIIIGTPITDFPPHASFLAPTSATPTSLLRPPRLIQI